MGRAQGKVQAAAVAHTSRAHHPHTTSAAPVAPVAPVAPGLGTGNLRLVETALRTADEGTRRRIQGRLPLGVMGGTRNRFSVTELENFISCPTGWTMKSIMGSKRTWGQRANKGQAIHSILQSAAMEKPEDREGFTRDRLRLLIQDRTITNREAWQYFRQLNAILGPYCRPRWPFDRSIAEMWLDSKDLVPGAEISGRADRVDVGPGGVLVVDYKNRREPKLKLPEWRQEEMQRYMYPLLAAEKLNAPPLGMLYLSLDPGGHDGSLTRALDFLDMSTVDTDWQMDSRQALANATEAIGKMKSGEWDGLGRHCPPWCAHHDLEPGYVAP